MQPSLLDRAAVHLLGRELLAATRLDAQRQYNHVAMSDALKARAQALGPEARELHLRFEEFCERRVVCGGTRSRAGHSCGAGTRRTW